ncbi:hypothetical protein [Parasphingopyxis marina]|uniref:Uncharacterized protein n=1 Tax=Parasphingopyxis marina TaxID=2761622 RepID=A0A842HS73_9SPHN|nr:hypothetical protein [Parasphingopyxis marina]MBC2776688.1 hypothetical protein [Parasphingopyxis marina]
MSDAKDAKDKRAKRLAEELRKNLRRRKGQAREQRSGGDSGEPAGD